ncbi:MAG: outer membrane protein assembly factor BamD [Bacteroidia bacterium]|nr:outer membrane protein assembly factor BamD [Bacteroidia bacterium]
MKQYVLAATVAAGIVVGLTQTGCNPVTKLARSPLIADRDSAAFALYRAGKYANASLLFEELLGVYRNTPRAEEILYCYATSLFRSRDYISAGHHYQTLAEQYSNGKYAQEALYTVGMCHYNLASDFDLDQAETLKAIESFQLFVGVYPDAPQVKELNDRVRELRDRLARKSFYNAELYYNIGQYKAGVTAAKVTMAEFPDSKYRENAQLLLFQSQTAYAENSIPARQRERFTEALTYYNQFVRRYPQSKFLREVERLKANIDRQLERLPPA